MVDRVVLVGGFPEPVGGVTTFVRRLAASDRRIEEVVDIYRSKEKAIPAEYRGKYTRLKNKWLAFMYLFLKMTAWRGKYVHFNFSTLRSLVFLIALPKHGAKWILMLHHGVLGGPGPDVLVSYLLRRCDHVVAMNDAQYETYRRYGVGSDRLVRASSYIKPVAGTPDRTFQQDIDSYFSAKPTFVASGYPTPLYNLDWCIRFVCGREQYQLALFLYGAGSEKSNIQEQSGRCGNVRVFWNQREDNFNYALSRSFYYLRPNSRDSFGVAVADAVNYGVPVLASDVCARFRGAGTFRMTTYESFEAALLNSLNHQSAGGETTSTPFVPFSYDLIG